MFQEQIDKYLFRRQFVLSPYSISRFESWQRIQVSNGCILTAHPDLAITVAHSQNDSLFLLGYIIDAHNPRLTDDQILQNIIDRSNTADDVFENIAAKCGRFVIIAKIGADLRIFSDACGLRQVFYHVDKQNSVWCSSQPHLVATELGIGINREIENDLKKTSLFSSPEHWYPGNITLFDRIFHLTPNHYFDLISKTCIRYWPRKRLDPISISECLPEVSKLLEGIIEGAVHRFNLAFAISCGYDSRTLLAASKKVAKKIHFFTQSSTSNFGNNPDVYIPSVLLNDLKLKHSVLLIPESLDKDFEKIFLQNVFSARIRKGLNAFSIYNHFKEEEVEIAVLYGNCSEITKRDRYRFPRIPKWLISGGTLAAMARMSQSRVAKEEFRRWLTAAKELTTFNIDLLDLMHWEQRVGNWGAMALSEYEIVFESLCPYSCRKYIEYMLRIPFRHRTKPNYEMHRAIMDGIWPEVLRQEINPEGRGMKKWVEDFLYRTGLYDYVRLIYIMGYKRFR